MAKSPFFLFAVIVTVAVSFVAAAATMQQNTPTAGVYSMTNQSANQTGQLISVAYTQAPVWVMPAIFLGMAILLISIFMLLKFKRR
jgi:hypothetical protein